MQEKDFILPESAAIMRYIATTKGVPDHWYPSKAKKLFYGPVCLPAVCPKLSPAIVQNNSVVVY